VETPFTRLVGCRHPLQQATMGGVAGPELAGAVAGAGALGMLCEFDVEPSSERMTQALALAGGGVVGMGFFGHWVHRDLPTFEEAAARLRVVEVFWTEPDAELVARARRSGAALVAWQVGSVESAVAAVDAGCDLVIAQGVEAGGHVRGTTPRDELLAGVLERVSVPVVAAGGIATGADVAAVLAAGAAGARVGTRFVATTESRGHPAYKQALVDARSGDDTVLTEAFGDGWPEAPHRVLRSALGAAERSGPGPYPVSTPSRRAEGDIAAMALYAGTGVGDVHAVERAAEVVRELLAGLS
jgi:NAD(P)H-dependent flavin oxidoreductase YrpB (nitropropane dioxygenase family)